jgi:hypothetical protein
LRESDFENVPEKKSENAQRTSRNVKRTASALETFGPESFVISMEFPVSIEI